MQNISRQRRLGIALTVCILFTACKNELTVFRITANSSKPIVQSLVPAVITQAKADTINHDISDVVAAATRGETCLAAVTGDKRQQQIGKARCYVIVVNEVRPILARHNIGGNSKLDLIAGIIGAAIDAFQAYHDAVLPTGGITVAAGQPITANDAADKELQTTLETLKKRMDALKK